MPQDNKNNTENDSLSEKADAAFQQAATKVIERAKQTGTPVVVWEEGKVKEVTPDEATAKPRTTRKKKTEGDNHE